MPEPTTIAAVSAGIQLLYEIFKKLNVSQSEKFEKEWEKYREKLTKAVMDGDIDAIAAITVKFYSM